MRCAYCSKEAEVQVFNTDGVEKLGKICKTCFKVVWGDNNSVSMALLIQKPLTVRESLMF